VGAVGAIVFLKGFLREAVEGKRRHSALRASPEGELLPVAEDYFPRKCEREK